MNANDQSEIKAIRTKSLFIVTRVITGSRNTNGGYFTSSKFDGVDYLSEIRLSFSTCLRNFIKTFYEWVCTVTCL